MTNLAVRFCVLFSAVSILFAQPSQAADVISELSLMDGSRIKGKVMSATATDVTVMSDFGTLRIALDKLTPASRASVMAQSSPDTEALLKRIQELEAQVAQLQHENESLRRQAMAAPVPATPPRSFAPQQMQPGSSGGNYTISSTGKRHNSGCRYYGTGRACSAGEGIACKICGG